MIYQCMYVSINKTIIETCVCILNSEINRYIIYVIRSKNRKIEPNYKI